MVLVLCVSILEGKGGNQGERREKIKTRRERERIKAMGTRKERTEWEVREKGCSAFFVSVLRSLMPSQHLDHETEHKKVNTKKEIESICSSCLQGNTSTRNERTDKIQSTLNSPLLTGKREKER